MDAGDVRLLREEDLTAVERVSERVFLEPGEQGRPAHLIQAWIGAASIERPAQQQR